MVFLLIGSDKMLTRASNCDESVILSKVLYQMSRIISIVPFPRYDSTVDVGGNRARLSRRQEVKYLTTRFDVSVVLHPSSVYFFVDAVSAATKP